MDELIIERLKAGDEKAFKYIYDQHYPLLCRFANQILNDASTAEEIVDDTIFYLWEHRADINITYSIRTYLMRAVRNRCLNELKSPNYRKELRLSSFTYTENMEFLDYIFVSEDHPLGYLLEKELEKEIIKGIEKLPDECRAVFKKSRLEEKKYDEIAVELNISVNTVKYHIKNALAILRQHLKDYLKFIIIYLLTGI
ncbi:MAG: RNA polymerase sigma-70 factor [Tannerella sp.]|jgi:RNA polymerase sigma-70 factor (ECF subfamily)|nr:RNA polymerase sigma-70 factor [Tannerella sp.]